MENNTNKSRKRSKSCGTWNYFTLGEPTDPDNPKESCNYCGTVYACHATRNETMNLNRHVSSCKKLLATLDETKKTLLFRKKEIVGEGLVGSMAVKSFSQDKCRRKVARMIVIDELSFSHVEGKGFLELVEELEPKFDVPCRKTVAKDVFTLYTEEKSKLKGFFSQLAGRICLTTDTWTSIQNTNYMVVTAHYIDASWNLHKKIINFCIILDHKGETIATILERCLLEWEIERVLTVTVDNASSNEFALTHLVKSIRHWKGLVLDGEFIHVTCFAHIVNLIVRNGLKEHNDVIMKIRKAVKYVKSSPSRMQKFKACVESAKIICKNNVCLDVPTRWNSTYLMLDTAEKFEKAFSKMNEFDNQFVYVFLEDENLSGPLTDEDWRVIREFIVLLKVFYDTMLKVSSTLHITSNVLFSEVCRLHRAIKKYASSDNSSLRTMAFGMQINYEKYWGNFSKVNHLMYVAIVLDPRYKMKFVKYCLLKLHGPETTNELVIELEHSIKRLYFEYKLDSSTNNTEQASRPVFDITHDSLDDDEFEATFRAELNKEDEHGGRGSELENYLLEKLAIFSNDVDILSWWKMHTSKYPTLSKIARDVLAIPISTVALESAFSFSGRVLNAFQSSLSPKTIEALICTQSWIRDSTKHIDIYEALDEVEEYEKDLNSAITEANKD